MMSDLFPACRLFALASVGLGLSATAWADPPADKSKPHGLRAPWIRRSIQLRGAEKAPEPLRAPPSEVNEGTAPSSPSTRLEVPSGANVKISIEVVGKENAAPARPPAEPEPAEPPLPVGLIPDLAHTPADHPIWGMDRIKPLPLQPIPDNPPPHEGAMIEFPYIVDSPDLIDVEVLEALPGRPISGERLIRPDGMLSLGFYGEIYVRGLTASQIKEKVVLHLRKFLPEEVLGLFEQDEEGKWNVVEPKDSNRVFVDVTAYNSKNYFIQGDVTAPGKLPHTGNETVLDVMTYAGGLIPVADPKNIRLIRPARGGKPARILKIDLEAITERGELDKNYQIFPGDRIVVGRNAVVKTTIEVDRLVAPMQTVINTTLQNSSAIRSLLQTTNPGATAGTATMTPEQRDALVKDWASFWWKVVSRPEGAALDERTFREALTRTLVPPAAEKPGEKR